MIRLDGAILAAYLPIGPQPILGHVCLQLDKIALLSNIAFTPEDQAPLPWPGAYTKEVTKMNI